MQKLNLWKLLTKELKFLFSTIVTCRYFRHYFIKMKTNFSIVEMTNDDCKSIHKLDEINQKSMKKISKTS
ncbi:hypothetical protein BpHYR1_015195 [Brachionus plicatilis]|uniref:Uncharacterized protein n=1 Tax=Brachionus plicatilis TaxID=10195 RepID=A0A3M7QK28_BRAPC|nr:hypothetical protein BpHYR1_015195 [Brachionus plicatilis]